MKEYLYGAYGGLGESITRSAEQVATVPVYVGVAPVNLVRGYATGDLINHPVRVSNMADAQRKGGYSKNWAAYGLCEAFTAHFDNPLGNIGPIQIINVLDPETHKKTEQTTRELTFDKGRCEFLSDTIILDSLLIADKVEGVDYLLTYDFAKGKVVISSANPEDPLTGTVSVGFYEVTPEAITEDNIKGQATEDGEYTGLAAIALLYPEQYKVVNLIAAPGWADRPAIYQAMVESAIKVNGHWGAFVVADLPLEHEGNKVDTMAKAVAWKYANEYTSELAKSYWPQGLDAEGRVYHLSTLAIVEYMRTDASHKSVPMETNGNKPIPIVRQYFGEDSQSRGFDQEQSKQLTKEGISTAVSWGGSWVLWGDSTDAYRFISEDDPDYGAVTIDPRAVFDINMRMLLHIVNDFQLEWSPVINEPMSLQLKERIISREQEKLDALVAEGALVGSPIIEYLPAENDQEEVLHGRFKWSISATPAPPLKSATAVVAYTDAGLVVFLPEEVTA